MLHNKEVCIVQACKVKENLTLRREKSSRSMYFFYYPYLIPAEFPLDKQEGI
jgi:hypothetical protein